jgi:site-specific recombinase XerD
MAVGRSVSWVGATDGLLTRRSYRAATLVNADDQPYYTLHQVRHTRGTEMIEQRYPLHVVQKTLGHLDPRSTQVYVELAEDQLRHELESHRR